VVEGNLLKKKYGDECRLTPDRKLGLGGHQVEERDRIGCDFEKKKKNQKVTGKETVSCSGERHAWKAAKKKKKVNRGLGLFEWGRFLLWQGKRGGTLVRDGCSGNGSNWGSG